MDYQVNGQFEILIKIRYNILHIFGKYLDQAFWVFAIFFCFQTGRLGHMSHLAALFVTKKLIARVGYVFP